MSFGTLTIFGQARAISVIVSNAEDGSLLPGVTVAAKGTAVGTITDASGNFQITLGAAQRKPAFDHRYDLYPEIYPPLVLWIR